MTNVVLDAETYYSAEISVTKMGTPNYVANSEAYIWGVAIQGGEAFCGTLAEVGPMMEQLAKDPAVQPIAANSGFDSAFFEKYWPAFHKPWFCVLDQAAWQQCPRNLAGLSGAILGEKVDKTIRDEMRGKRYEDLPAEEQVKVQEYCLNDAVKELEVFEAMKPMSSFEAEVAAHTRMINRRGVQIDMELLARDKTRLEKMRFDALRSIPWYRDAKPLSHSALAEYCNAHGIPVPKSTAKDDDECDDMMTDSPELAVIIGYMRRFRKANTMLRKCSTLDARVDAGGILALDLLYCGAPHTRRWSSKGFNIQNLDKEPLKTGVDGETVWTRNWIIPRPGFIFYIADYAQIEPRCLNYLAGNEEMMAALRTGFSYYEAYSRAAKGWKGAAGTLKKEFGKERYTKLKNEALGCVAEGTLILTRNRGYQRIENILKSDWVWDGLTWVQHTGIVYRGCKSVVRVGHEDFTADHEIFINEQSKKQAGAFHAQEQAEAMAWRQSTHPGWTDVWKVACGVSAAATREGLFIGALLMSSLLKRVLGFFR